MNVIDGGASMYICDCEGSEPRFMKDGLLDMVGPGQPYRGCQLSGSAESTSLLSSQPSKVI